ncbi:MAG: polyamine aminopropyltransferase [Candidatus Krumholzibacteriia bacterium]
MDLWVEERNQDTHGVMFRVEKVLFRGKSEFQTVEVVETAAHGRMLLNDGLIMVSERDECVYHEMIAHVPLLSHPDPHRVLVIGGGDGGTVRECLKHPSVEHVHLVEIDAMVVDACREHIPATAGCLADPRVKVSIADGVAFVNETTERYDVVLVDSTDPVGMAAPLFGPEFYGDVARVLTDEGIVVSQCENPWYEAEAQRALLDILRDVFEVTEIYNYHNLTYPGGLWSFSFASKGPRPAKAPDAQRVDALGQLKWWTPALQQACFALPAFQRRALGLAD